MKHLSIYRLGKGLDYVKTMCGKELGDIVTVPANRLEEVDCPDCRGQVLMKTVLWGSVDEKVLLFGKGCPHREVCHNQNVLKGINSNLCKRCCEAGKYLYEEVDK